MNEFLKIGTTYINVQHIVKVDVFYRNDQLASIKLSLAGGYSATFDYNEALPIKNWLDHARNPDGSQLSFDVTQLNWPTE